MEAAGESASTSLLFRSDFSGFEQLECHDGSVGSSEVESDVEDAIYAQMYFEEFIGDQEMSGIQNSDQNGSNSTPLACDIGSSARGGLSVSLLLDTPKSKAKKKKRRARKRKVQGAAPPPRPTGSGTMARGSPSNGDAASLNDIGGEGVKVTEGASESETSNLKAKRCVSREQHSTDAVIVISSDSDAEKGNGSKVVGDAVKSDDIIEIVSSDASDDEEEEEGSESDEGEASSDMQLSDLEEGQDYYTSLLDPWHVNQKDKMGREAYDRCYGDPKTRFSNKNTGKCANCKQRYHTARNCPWPKRHQVCYLCGGPDHISSRCPHDLCTYCYQKKHRGRSCSTPWSSPRTQCQRCFMNGHHASICPDNWRQFHNTTYADDRLLIIDGENQRSFARVFCYNCSLPQHYGFECTRTRPRGWPQTHLPLIAKYDLQVWPPHNLRQLREEMGIARGQEVTRSHGDHQHGKRTSSREDTTGGYPRKRSRGSRGRKRSDDASRNNNFEERRRNFDKVSIGRHPSLNKERHSTSGDARKLLDRRSNSIDTGSLTNRGSSLLGPIPHDDARPRDGLRTSALLQTPPPGHMLPPLNSFSASHSGSRERRGVKRSHHDLPEDHHYHHRRDSEPANMKRPRLTEPRHSLEDFPREPLIDTPPLYRDHTHPRNNSTPYYPPPPRRAYSDVSKQVHHHHGGDHTHHNDQPHSSRDLLGDRHLPSPTHQLYPHHHKGDARELLNRHVSYDEDYSRGAFPPYQRRLSDISEQAGGIRTPPVMTVNYSSSSDRHKQHRIEDVWMVNDRGFRGQPHLLRNNYRH